jgi:enoyl-CoA hydratase/carnithine racemase
MTTLDGRVVLTVHGAVARVTIDRAGKKNSLTAPMWEQLRDLLVEIGRRTDVRVVVISGEGDDFSTGADLWGRSSNGKPPHPSVTMRVLSEAASALRALPQPTVAVVRGLAVGAGCNLALACDFVIVDSSARFCEIFAVRGVTPDFGGTWLLPRLVGLRRAMELALLGEFVGADEALRLGLVNRVAEPGELDAVADDTVARLAAGPPIANAQTKRLVNEAFESSFTAALASEALAQTVNFKTADTKEALMAFAERRSPDFQGR